MGERSLGLHSVGLGSPKATLEEGAFRGRTWIIGGLKIRNKGYGRQGRGGWGCCRRGVSPKAAHLPERQLQGEGGRRRHHTARVPTSYGVIAPHRQPWPPSCFKESRIPTANRASAQPLRRLSSRSATSCSLKTRHPR